MTSHGRDRRTDHADGKSLQRKHITLKEADAVEGGRGRNEIDRHDAAVDAERAGHVPKQERAASGLEPISMIVDGRDSAISRTYMAISIGFF
jgi:hypothetical protein